ncbi:MAG: Two-component transcriptional response regulator, OmpR family [Ktedonobacterales bacterium]|jgi:DNA-binding response OmpR family regulator|nr:MAG: Two-component transcriptional response regulator, OmpR family [Ktedonobacterales bacterium]
MRILVIEDNRRLSAALAQSLSDAGYAVDTAYDGQEGQEFAEAAPYDAIILDILLPVRDGLVVCRALRARRVNTPVIMLTARDTVADRVRGLDSGADDYLVKPFALSELLARLRALLRREAPSKGGLLEAGDLRLDPATRFVERAGHSIELTAKQYALLEYFLRHPNQLLTREMIESHVWSYDFDATSNVVDVYVRRLRREIDDPFDVKLLETVRGAGYRLRVPHV